MGANRDTLYKLLLPAAMDYRDSPHSNVHPHVFFLVPHLPLDRVHTYYSQYSGLMALYTTLVLLTLLLDMPSSRLLTTGVYIDKYN